MKNSNIYFVTVSLDYESGGNAFGPALLGTTEDSASMVRIMRDYTDNIYTLTNAQATFGNLEAVLSEATSNPDGFLIFHCSCHGSRSLYADGICLYDRMMYDTEFWNIIKRGKCRKVMTMFATCYSASMSPTQTQLQSSALSSINISASASASASPDESQHCFFTRCLNDIFNKPKTAGNRLAASADDNNFRILCWSPCGAGELSYMMQDRAELPNLVWAVFNSKEDFDNNKRTRYGTLYGHEFIGRFCYEFDSKLTYQQIWDKIGPTHNIYGWRNASDYYNKRGGTVLSENLLEHREKVVFGESFEDEPIFFAEKSQDGGDDEDQDEEIPTVKKYTVEFRDYDNTTIRTYTVDEGALAPLPDNPTRAGYDFTGWKPDYGAITKDTVYIAQYKVKDAGGGKDVNPVSDAVELSTTLIRSGEDVSPVVDDPTYHPGSKRPTPHFYGYRNKTTGPGDSCFSNILTAAQQYGHAMLMVLDNGAKLGSDFCADCNDDTDFGGGRYLVQWSNLTCWNQLSGGMCYFRGSSTAPKACADAWGFAHSNGINTDTGLTLVGFIHDGSQFIVQGEALQASVERFKARGEQVLKQLNQHRKATAGLKPRVLSKKKDIFDAEIVRYNYNTGTYNAGDLARNDNIEIGVWNGNLQKVLEKADKENVPVFVMFGVANCGGHWQTLKSDQFVNWQLSCNMYLSYLYAPWNKGGYTEQWLESKTYQAYPTPGSSIGDYTYHCPEYAVHWKQPSGNELNIGKYLSRNGDSSGLLIEPYLIEGVLSGYFSQYEPISYDDTIIRKDNQQGFGVIGRAGVLRTDNIANKTNYSVSVPYKNLDNIKVYSENYDAPFIAIYFNSSGAAMGAGNGMTLQQAFNVDRTFDTWIRLEDTAIIWADVEASDGGKASENGEWHRWIADLDQHPERASDRWAFRFYSKPHGVDKSYSFQQIYDKTYDPDKTKATENLKAFMYETFKPFYDNVQVEEEKELFIVRFWDFDGTELIPQQQVQKGLNAVPPETDPVRAGYTFIGYSPNGINVQSDLTCFAQYKADESESDSGKDSDGGSTSQYFAEHTYGPGQFQMRTSNNISAIQVVGDMRSNGMTTQLTSITFQDNLFQIMPSCFMNCGRLRSVEIKSQTRWIGDYAFYGCSRLESVNALAYPKHTQVNTIGAHAFQNTGLTDIAIDLTASQYGAGVGEFAFAGCTKLKNVRLTRTAYIGRQAFDGCTALTSVSLPNSQGYYYPEAFANCTALTSIVIPPKIQTLNNGLFKNCASLGAVEIQDSVSERSQLNYLGASAFTGCDQLTSISIPASISSITQIDPEFLQGSAIKAIHFNGLSDEVFSTGYIEQRTTTVNGYVMNTNTFKTVAADALARSIPIVMITVENSPEVDIYSKDCPRCRALAAQLNSSDWQTYMNSVKSKCYFVMASQQLNEQLFNIVSNPADATLNSPFRGMYNFGSMWSLWPKVIVLYKDLDGKVSVNKVGWAEGNDTPGALRLFVDPIVSKANNPVQDESRLSAAISKLGSPLSYIMAYSKTGKEYKISADSYVETYVPPEVDTTTVSDFKTGKWYYNAAELKAYADSSRLPVFAEFSDRYCEPCIKFRNEIYERSDFQNWVAKQPYLFCRIETEYFDEFNRMFTQPYFIRTTWAKNAQVTYPGMIFYWNREQNPIWDVVGYGDNPVSYAELQDMIQKKFKMRVNNKSLDVKVET